MLYNNILYKSQKKKDLNIQILQVLNNTINKNSLTIFWEQVPLPS